VCSLPYSILTCCGCCGQLAERIWRLFVPIHYCLAVVLGLGVIIFVAENLSFCRNDER
jgi:hypothetical protein